jgi:glycyl-tRNA synthetase
LNQVLASELPGLVGSLSFKKSMRWDGFGTAYSRPMRWLLALHGATPIPFAYGGLQAAATTRVLRNAAQPELQVCWLPGGFDCCCRFCKCQLLMLIVSL